MATIWVQRIQIWWQKLQSSPWMYDGLVLGATVAAISSTSVLAFSSALMKFPRLIIHANSAFTNSMVQEAMLKTACHECHALRLFGANPKTAIAAATGLLPTDSLMTEILIALLMSFLIVTFSVFLVRELR
ncbi:hypothetical protein CY35_03G114500 [Sphagnum magellanicum]|nr:hypothetical protein CY35_03G114500 [Sphagnum magellanicum]